MHGRGTVLTSSRRTLGLLAAAAAAALLAACGGSSSPKATPGMSTTAGGAGTVPGASTTLTEPTTSAAGGGSPTTVPATTAPATTAPTAPVTAVPAGPQPCPTSQLQLALSGANGAAGTTYVTLNLLNTGGSTCTVAGYPGVSYVTGSTGTQIGAAATRDPSTPVATVALAPGHAAQSVLRIANPYNFDQATCQLTTVRGLRVYPPGQTAAAFVSDPGPACANPAFGQLTIGAARSGPSGGGIGPANG